MGTLSLLKGTFKTQELNWGLLNYRRILYQLSYKGRPKILMGTSKYIKKDNGQKIFAIRVWGVGKEQVKINSYTL